MSLKGIRLFSGVSVATVDADPSTSGGIAAPIGSLGLLTTGGLFIKTGSGNTAWSGVPVSIAGASGLVNQIAVWSSAGAVQGLANLLYNDTTQRLSIGQASPLSTVHVKGLGAESAVRIERTANTLTSDLFWANLGSTADATLWQASLRGSADSLAPSGLVIGNNPSGTFTPRLSFHTTGESVFNDGGAALGFRVATPSVSNALVVDPTRGSIGLGLAADTSVRLGLTNTTESDTIVKITNTTVSGNARIQFLLNGEGSVNTQVAVSSAGILLATDHALLVNTGSTTHASLSAAGKLLLGLTSAGSALADNIGNLELVSNAVAGTGTGLAVVSKSGKANKNSVPAIRFFRDSAGSGAIDTGNTIGRIDFSGDDGSSGASTPFTAAGGTRIEVIPESTFSSGLTKQKLRVRQATTSSNIATVAECSSDGYWGFGPDVNTAGPPLTAVHVFGGFAINPVDLTISGVNPTITVGHHCIMHVTFNATTGSTRYHLTDGIVDGQIIIIVTLADTGDVNALFSTGDANLLLASNFNPVSNKTLTLTWDSSRVAWREMART